MTTADSSSANTVPDKSMLFCPECGRESRYDGDWRLLKTATSERYICPDCGTEITARPHPDAPDPWHPAAYYRSMWQTWDVSVQMWRRVWQQSLSLI